MTNFVRQECSFVIRYLRQCVAADTVHCNGSIGRCFFLRGEADIVIFALRKGWQLAQKCLDLNTCILYLHERLDNGKADRTGRFPLAMRA